MRKERIFCDVCGKEVPYYNLPNKRWVSSRPQYARSPKQTIGVDTVFTVYSSDKDRPEADICCSCLMDIIMEIHQQLIGREHTK